MSPLLYQENLAFKILADPTLYNIAFSKQQPAESAGKFLTIYIPRAEELRRIAKELAVLMEQMALNPIAPPVSDNEVSFSKNLSYRYGSFTESAFVRAGDGHLIEDCREYFRLPPGVGDPFTKGGVSEYDDDGTENPRTAREIRNWIRAS